MAAERTPETAARPRGGGDGAPKPESLAPRLLGVIKTVAAELHPRRAELRAASLDSALDRDFGFDSLGRVELIVRIERAFDVALPERVFSTAETPRELLAAVLAAAGAGASAVPPTSEMATVEVGEAAEIPYAAQTLVEVLDWHATAHPDRPHIRFYDDHDEGEAITYGRLSALAHEAAAGLERLELGRGEAVVIMLPTGAEYFASFLGVLVAGGVPVPVYPPGRPTQVEEHVLRHAAICANCRARIMITTPEAQRFANLLRTLADGLGAVVSFDELTAGSARPVVRPPVAAADVALLQYTSGSTGDPKGVVLTHANLLANIRAMAEALDAGPRDVFVSWLPLYHDMGLIGAWLGSMHHAIPLVIMSPLSFLTRPQRWLWAMHRYRGTLSGAPNFAFDLCLRRIADKDIEGLDLGSWRVAFNGAEPVSPDTLERFSARFAAHGFSRTAMMPVYGLAECSVGLAFPPLGRGPRIDRVKRRAFTATGIAETAHEGDSGALRFVECGQPLPRHEIRIVDGHGRELPDRQQGHLQFRGPSATGGYLHDPERTQALFGEGGCEGWLESGDLAYVAGGGIYVTGRVKDVVIKAGRNIYPAELEEAVGHIAGIRKGNVAVFGSPDPESGVERLIVVAETRERSETVRADLVAHINAIATDRLDAAPDHVVLAPPNSILRTSSGKVRRDATRTLYERNLIGKPRPELRRQLIRLALAGLPARFRRVGRALGAGMFAGYAWAMLLVLAVFAWMSVAVLPGLSARWTLIRAASRALARWTRTPFSVHGIENLPAADRACVLVSNHASYLDGCVLSAALPRPLAFVVKAELEGQFVPRIFLRRSGAHFVERFDKEKGIEDAHRIARALSAPPAIVYFPEGTFTRIPGLFPFHMGAFTAAAEAGVPVVPIAIRGTRSILRSGSAYPRRGAISVVVGPPIETDAGAPDQADAVWTGALDLRAKARAFILHHCGEPDLEGERSPM